MASNNDLRIELTSTAIPASANGYYTFEQISFLFPHEPIRRELRRGKIAVENIKFGEQPWKIKYLHKWLVEFLLPIIHDHHDAEDRLLYPDFKQCGVTVPENIDRGHDQLVIYLNQIEKLNEEIYDLYFNQKKTNDAEVKFNQLKTVFCEEFSRDFLQHLADEETFWPAVIKDQIGEAKFDEINKKMHTEAKKQKSANNFLMSVFDSMGYEFDISNPTHDLKLDTRWCNEDVLNERIINKIPAFVRSWIFSPMNRKYQYYKTLINTAAYGSEDVVPLEYSEGCVIF